VKGVQEIKGSVGARAARIYGYPKCAGKPGNCWMPLKQRIDMIQFYLFKDKFGSPSKMDWRKTGRRALEIP
jgi:hypothetical protein